MKERAQSDVGHHLIMLAITAPGAAIIWTIFHFAYVDLSRSAKAVGYIDPMTQVGITLGYWSMLGGSIVLALIALYSAFQAVRLFVTER
jgi:hypothetical protein